jgi:stress response protein SCP2
MAINLTKGQTINLEKSEFDLSKVTIGLGWDIAKAESKGFLGKLFGGKSDDEFDLDAVAILLDNRGKVQNVSRDSKGQINLKDGDVIFYNSKTHPSGHIWLTGDNRTGAGDGDDEQIIVDLNSLHTKYDKIVFLVTIYQGQTKNQHFGKVTNAFIRAVDARGKEIARYTLSGPGQYENMCSMLFAEVYRHDGGWKFRAVGNATPSDSFVDIFKTYL